jgi:hypothetical protein
VGLWHHDGSGEAAYLALTSTMLARAPAFLGSQRSGLPTLNRACTHFLNFGSVSALSPTLNCAHLCGSKEGFGMLRPRPGAPERPVSVLCASGREQRPAPETGSNSATWHLDTQLTGGARVQATFDTAFQTTRFSAQFRAPAEVQAQEADRTAALEAHMYEPMGPMHAHAASVVKPLTAVERAAAECSQVNVHVHTLIERCAAALRAMRCSLSACACCDMHVWHACCASAAHR